MIMSRRLTPKNDLKVNGNSFERIEELKSQGVNINEKNFSYNER